jgi:nitrate/nitrite-specific signal transduction histidine kinase
MPLKPISARALTLGYIFALLVIAGLSFFSHAALEYSLRSNEGSAAIINKSGRQRMLSQRIASLAAQYRSGDASASGDLTRAINEFETAHNALAEAAQTEVNGGDQVAALKKLYFAPQGDSLDAHVRGFVADARRVASLPAGDPAADPPLLRLFAAARTRLLTELNNVVTVEQQRTEHRLSRLEYLQWAIFVIVMLTLVVEAMVIFRPMIRRIVAYTADLLRLATTDVLTGADTRRSFMERCETQII